MRRSNHALVLRLLALAAGAAAALACSSEPPPAAPPSDASVAVAPPPAPPPPAVTASAAASAAPAAPSGGRPAGKLNVLLVTIDSLRADMPWAGYPRDIAPVLTAFEKKAVSYTRAYSVSSYTAMSLGGMLAGRYPSELDRSGYFFEQYPDSVTMFPELLQKAGVRTLSAHAHFYFDRKSGFRQGFDDYRMVPGLKENNKTDENITSPEHEALAEQMLSDKANTGSGKPFFAWFHFLDPHDEYMPHPGIGPYGKKARDKYDAEVTFVDQHVGKLLDFVKAQPWGKDTVVIVSADHGEAFGEHKMYRHGFEVWEVLTHVPLMIQAPGATARHIDAPRSAIDFAPTILELTGAPASSELEGKSLVGEIWGGPAEERDVIIDLPRTTDNDRHRALVHGKYKIISFGDDDAFELYDVVADPGELHDLHREDKATFEDMKARYKAASAKIHDKCPAHTEHLRSKNKARPC
ncbi:MAG TPA: sulfatase [Byssovorax sp.]|jgi:arylsulfatase A-like enzyme